MAQLHKDIPYTVPDTCFHFSVPMRIRRERVKTEVRVGGWMSGTTEITEATSEEVLLFVTPDTKLILIVTDYEGGSLRVNVRRWRQKTNELIDEYYCNLERPVFESLVFGS